MSAILGIDFGSHHSSVGIFVQKTNKIEIITNDLGINYEKTNSTRKI